MFPFSSMSEKEGNIRYPYQSQGEGSPTKTTVSEVKPDFLLIKNNYLLIFTPIESLSSSFSFTLEVYGSP